VHRYLGGRGQLAVDDGAVQVEDGHHAGRQLADHSACRRHRHQVVGADGEVPARPDDKTARGEPPARRGQFLAFPFQQHLLPSIRR
jgi:hypothetical protein